MNISTSFFLSLVCISSVAFAQERPDNFDDPRPIEAVDTVFIEELTWMEVRDALADGTTTAIVASGGIEQNGPYVATGKHNVVLRATTEAIARELGNALVAPILKLVPEGGFDPPSGHMRYPGTVSLSQETFRAVVTDVCRSLAVHGFTDIVLIADSGGNMRGMQEVAEKLNQEWAGVKTRLHFIEEYYEEDRWSYEYLKQIGVEQIPDVQSASRAGIHDDYHYEAIMMTVDPASVRMNERIKVGLFEINGVDMNPASKTIANGQKLVDYRTEITVKAIRESMEAAR